MQCRIIPFLAILILIMANDAFSQKTSDKDSLKMIDLEAVEITSYRSNIREVEYLDEVHETYITAGKRNEVITVHDMPANIPEKNGRQVFAKVPGVFVYDMDGSGNQVNIAARGLDPHRSWEFNVRQNGIMTNSDIYGYPASHYSPPMEAIEKIEIIRGTSSLQYGAEFGGMINYIIKKPDTTKAISFESINSAGSYGLLSTYNAVGGKVGNLSYYAYYHRRDAKGYRHNSRSEAEAQFASVAYDFSDRIRLTAELGRSKYLYQIPGPLTDSIFNTDPLQSTRSRNYYSPDIYVPSITLDWKISERTRLSWVTSGIFGVRSSVQFIGFANARDEINPATLEYAPRQVDIDNFNSKTTELRIRHSYNIGKVSSVLAGGIRYIDNDMHRRQLGKGTTGTDYDLTITEPEYGRNIYYRTNNIAVSVENLFRITPKFLVSPGFRMESGVTKRSGSIVYYPEEQIPLDIEHNFPLFGVSAQYDIGRAAKIYGGWSQSYRPVILAEVIPPTPLDVVDEDLKDAYGYNLELGARGNIGGKFRYDLTLFRMLYQNRLGNQVLTDENGEPYIFKTNIGDSETHGVELYAEYNFIENFHSKLSIFTSTAFFDATYASGMLRSGSENIDISGNRLETVPELISRNGVQFSYKGFAAVLQYSYTAESYSDALNTEEPLSSGAAGIVPSYGILDLNMSYRFMDGYMLRFGVNNVTDEQYFTKRPNGYPGAGVWSSDGRSFVATVAINL